MTQKGTIYRECDGHHAHPSSHLGRGRMPRPRRRPAAAQAPLTNRTFLTTSRSLGYLSKSIARKGEQRQRGKVSRQEVDNKTRGQTSAERLQDGGKEWKLVIQGYNLSLY